MYEQRIADKVFEAIDQQSVEPLVTWLTSMGCKVVSRDEGSCNLQGIAGVNGAIILADPNTTAVMCGFLLAGMYWPHAFPGLQSTINKRWKERTNKAKEAASVAVP